MVDRSERRSYVGSGFSYLPDPLFVALHPLLCVYGVLYMYGYGTWEVRALISIDAVCGVLEKFDVRRASK